MRAAGRIPGILYGKDDTSTAISIDTREFDGVLRKHGSGAFILDLKLEGQEDRDLKAIIKELQRDPVTSRILHVDLLHISMTQMISVNIPIHTVGTAIGVKEGGLLEHLCREIEVECQAASIPEDIKIDISELQKGDSIHVSDLVLPEGVTSLTPGDRVVTTIVAKAVVVEPTPAEAEAAAEAEEKPEGEEEAAPAEEAAEGKETPEKS